MHITTKDLLAMDKIRRLNIINSVSGIKPANLIGSISPEGQTNLAIFSSVVHLGSNPPLLGFILRPKGEVPRHTYDNLMSTGYYTINHIYSPLIEQAHYTAAKFGSDESEFEGCKFTEEYLEGFTAPFVKESKLKIGLRWVEEIPIKINNTSMIIGQIEHIILPEESLDENGYVDLALIGDVGISGLNRYYDLKKITEFPYARRSELPDFK